MYRSHRVVGRAKPPGRHFDVAQVLRGVPAARLSSAGNGASFSAFRQHTRVRLLPTETPERTRVEIAHRNLERHGEGWQGVREGGAGDQGWPLYLRRYAHLLAKARCP